MLDVGHLVALVLLSRGLAPLPDTAAAAVLQLLWLQLSFFLPLMILLVLRLLGWLLLAAQLPVPSLLVLCENCCWTTVHDGWRRPHLRQSLGCHVGPAVDVGLALSLRAVSHGRRAISEARTPRIGAAWPVRAPQPT